MDKQTLRYIYLTYFAGQYAKKEDMDYYALVEMAGDNYELCIEVIRELVDEGLVLGIKLIETDAGYAVGQYQGKLKLTPKGIKEILNIFPEEKKEIINVNSVIESQKQKGFSFEDIINKENERISKLSKKEKFQEIKEKILLLFWDYKTNIHKYSEGKILHSEVKSKIRKIVRHYYDGAISILSKEAINELRLDGYIQYKYEDKNAEIQIDILLTDKGIAHIKKYERKIELELNNDIEKCNIKIPDEVFQIQTVLANIYSESNHKQLELIAQMLKNPDVQASMKVLENNQISQIIQCINEYYSPLYNNFDNMFNQLSGRIKFIEDNQNSTKKRIDEQYLDITKIDTKENEEFNRKNALSITFEGILGRNCGTITPYYDSDIRLQEKGYIVENGTYVLRGFAKMSDLVDASDVDQNNYQRTKDFQHIKDIKNFLKKGKVRFLPEVVLVARNEVQVQEINLNLKGKQLGRFQNINYRKITVAPKSLYRVDGNHRLEAYDKNAQDYYIPFSIILWHVDEDLGKNDKNLKQQEKNAVDNEAFLFYLLNAKSKPLTLEDNIKGIVNSDINVWKDENIKDVNFIFPHLRGIYNDLNNDNLFKKSHYKDVNGNQNVWTQYLNILNEIFIKENKDKKLTEEYTISFDKEQCKEMVCNTLLLLNKTDRFQYLREHYKKFPQLVFYLYYLKFLDNDNKINIESDLEDINMWAEKYKHDDNSFENPISMYENAMKQIQRGEINIFVAMPYYSQDDIKQFNLSYKKVITEIIKKKPKLKDRLKLFPIMEHVGETKNILNYIDSCIDKCQIFIADVSNDPSKNDIVNPNVMYELGVARQKGKPCIIIRNELNKNELIFDIKPMSVYSLKFENPDVNFVPKMITHIEEIIGEYYIL